jgi:hypothetical protein
MDVRESASARLGEVMLSQSSEGRQLLEAMLSRFEEDQFAGLPSMADQPVLGHKPDQKRKKRKK